MLKHKYLSLHHENDILLNQHKNRIYGRKKSFGGLETSFPK